MYSTEASVRHYGDDIAFAELGREVFDDGIGIRKGMSGLALQLDIFDELAYVQHLA